MMSMRGGTGLLLGIAMSIPLTPSSLAAYDGFLAPFAEIPLTKPLLTGARGVGMGGAYLAVGDDASTVSWNPAALTRVKRIELSGGITKLSFDRDGEAFGEPFGTSISRTNLSSLRFAYPFPTFRGSLVFGLCGDRVQDFNEDFLAAYEDSIRWEETEGEFLKDVWGQTEDYITEGGIYAWTVGAAVEASSSVSLGAAVSYWTGEYGRHFRWDADDVYSVSESYEGHTRLENTQADVSGLSGTLGALVYLSRAVTLGIVVDTPVTLSFEGISDTTWIWEGPVSARLDTTVSFVDKLTLPFSFSAGLAWMPTDLIMAAADIRYTDWSEMNYEGSVYLGDPAGRELAFRATTDYRLGLEVTVPQWPLRLRAGYMSRPISYKGLAIDKDRSYVTLGAGILIDTVLAIDVAWMKAASERSASAYDYAEGLDESAFMLEASYRF